ncbi:MAG: DUF4332 domain-containing protein [Anaerolineales bacterium]
MERFFKFLKRGGRTDEVAERVIRLVQVFVEFQLGRINGSPRRAREEDLDAFIEFIDSEGDELPKHDDIIPSANSYLWALRYYFRFLEIENLERYAGLLREARIKRKPFDLKDFRGVDPEYIARLKEAGICNINQMLKAGKTPELRQALSLETGILEEAVLEFVRLSDLARIPGIKGVRARLYHDAGIDSVEKMAGMAADEILEITAKFVADSGFEGIPPLPAEVRYSIAKAQSLPKVVDYG